MVLESTEYLFFNYKFGKFQFPGALIDSSSIDTYQILRLLSLIISSTVNFFAGFIIGSFVSLEYVRLKTIDRDVHALCY